MVHWFGIGMTAVLFALIPGSICVVIPIVLILAAYGLGVSRNHPEGADSRGAVLATAYAVAAFTGAIANVAVMILFVGHK